MQRSRNISCKIRRRLPYKNGHIIKCRQLKIFSNKSIDKDIKTMNNQASPVSYLLFLIFASTIPTKFLITKTIKARVFLDRNPTVLPKNSMATTARPTRASSAFSKVFYDIFYPV